MNSEAIAIVPPRIGQVWPGQGGVYMGIMRGEDGGPDYHLVVEKEFDEYLDWKDAMAQAAKVEADGHKDFVLPTRYELALCFANRCELFEKDWYWSSSQHAGDGSYAWMQVFGNGLQDWLLKSGRSRARVVRRINI